MPGALQSCPPATGLGSGCRPGRGLKLPQSGEEMAKGKGRHGWGHPNSGSVGWIGGGHLICRDLQE